MRLLLLASLAALLAGCGERESDSIDELEVEAMVAHYASFNDALRPLLDPAKLDTLVGKRAATPRLRKACYWLEAAQRAGYDTGDMLDGIHEKNSTSGLVGSARDRVQRGALLRNVTILERLGCLDAAGMEKLRRGKAPTITKGPYAGELATGDHIIPRSVCPELDNKLFNLEFMPETLNQKKGAKVGDRQLSLAREWNDAGLLSDEGLKAVRRARFINVPADSKESRGFEKID